MHTQTITVLYYPSELAIKLQIEVLYDMEVSSAGSGVFQGSWHSLLKF